jgi:hypothetical protein
MAEKSNVPTAPHFPGMPRDFAGRWEMAYAKAFRQAEVNHPGDETEQRAVASREANRLFAVDEPENYDQAMAIEDWKVLHRQQMGSLLKLVTIDGKKYSFPVPPPVEQEKGKTAKGGGKE